MQWLIDRSTLNLTLSAVARALADHLNGENDIVWPGLNCIAWSSKCALSTVKKALTELAEAGFVERVHVPLGPIGIEGSARGRGSVEGFQLHPGKLVLRPKYVRGWKPPTKARRGHDKPLFDGGDEGVTSELERGHEKTAEGVISERAQDLVSEGTYDQKQSTGACAPALTSSEKNPAPLSFEDCVQIAEWALELSPEKPPFLDERTLLDHFGRTCAAVNVPHPSMGTARHAVRAVLERHRQPERPPDTAGVAGLELLQRTYREIAAGSARRAG